MFKNIIAFYTLDCYSDTLDWVVNRIKDTVYIVSGNDLMYVVPLVSRLMVGGSV